MPVYNDEKIVKYHHRSPPLGPTDDSPESTDSEEDDFPKRRRSSREPYRPHTHWPALRHSRALNRVSSPHPIEAGRRDRDARDKGQSRRETLLNDRRKDYRGRSHPQDSDSDSGSTATFPPHNHKVIGREIVRRPRGDLVVGSPRRPSASRAPLNRHDDDADGESSIYSSSDDDDSFSRKQMRNRKLLYGGLAAITSMAAANNIFQAAKAHKARKAQLEEGGKCSHEEEKLKEKHRLMNVISLGVAAVGLYNVRNGWKKMAAQGR